MANTIIWEGRIYGNELSCDEPGFDTRSKNVRAIYDNYNNVFFEVEDGKDRMNCVRWLPLTIVPKNFILDAAKIMSKQDV